MRRSAIIVLATLVSTIVFGSTVANAADARIASSTGLTGSLVKDKVTYYTASRTITAGGSNIYVQKTDGPEIDVMWYKCSDRNVHGAWYRLQNADPTPRIRIGAGFAVNTAFCLAAWDHGNNSTDTWSGTLWWNVSS